MKNILLLLATFVAYYGVLDLLHTPETMQDELFRAGMLLLLVTPFKFNRRIYTVFGNSVSQTSIYSIWSIYSKTNGNLYSVINFLSYQRSVHNRARTCLNILSFQRGLIESYSFVNMLSLQTAGYRHFGAIPVSNISECKSYLSILSFQNAVRSGSVVALVSILSIHNAPDGLVKMIAGLPLCLNGAKIHTCCAISFYHNSVVSSTTRVGFAIYRQSGCFCEWFVLQLNERIS